MEKNEKPAGRKSAGQGAPTSPEPASPSGVNTENSAAINTLGDAVLSNQDGSTIPGSAADTLPPAAAAAAVLGGIAPAAELGDQASNASPAGGELSLATMVFDTQRERAVAVTAHRDGYRRAGRAWTKAPEVVRLTELTEEQWLQLQADSNIRMSATWINADTDQGGEFA